MGDLPVNPLVVLGVGSSFAFSGLFYHLYQEKKKELQKLKEIPFFQLDGHLVKVLKANPQKRLRYVAVEGLVEADGEPLTSQFVPQCRGVIQKITVVEHWKYWNDLNMSWDRRPTNRKETNNSVPFRLVSPDAYINDVHLKVQNPLENSECLLERVHHRVRHADDSLVNLAIQGLSGEKPVAKEETEEMLRVGSTMTGFGEVVLEGRGVMRLQAPLDNRKYILVPTDYRSYIDRHERSVSMWKTLTAVTGLTGTSLLVHALYNVLGRQDDR